MANLGYQPQRLVGRRALKRVITQHWLQAALARGGPEPDSYTAAPKEDPMSYSFSVRAPDKAEAARLIATELDKVVAAQPTHQADRDQAEQAVTLFLALLPDDPTKQVLVNVHGSLGWIGSNEAPSFTNASIGLSASLEQVTSVA